MGRGVKKKKAKAAETAQTKAQKSAKKSKKQVDTGDEPVEDIDAILQQWELDQNARHKVTEESNSPPPSRRANASLTVNPLALNELLFFGGEYFDGQQFHMYNDFYRYNIEKNEWRKYTSPIAPGPRSSHQFCVLPTGRGFLFGGEFVSPRETSFFHYKDFWSLDLATNVWDKIELAGSWRAAARPSSRSGHRMIVFKHFLVLFGGFYDAGADTKYFDDLWVFDTSDWVWTKLELPEPRPRARSGFQFFTNGETINLFGGYAQVPVKGQKRIQGVVLNDMWTLRLNLKELQQSVWEKRRKGGGCMPSLRSGCTIVHFKNKGILFGGVSDVEETDEALTSVCHNDLYQYSMDANKWYPLTLKKPKDMNVPEFVQTEPCPRFNAMMAVSKNTLFLFGGIHESGGKEIFLEDFWSVNLDKLTPWTSIVSDEVQRAKWLAEESDDESDDDEMTDKSVTHVEEGEEDDGGEALSEDATDGFQADLEAMGLDDDSDKDDGFEFEFGKGDEPQVNGSLWQEKAFAERQRMGKSLRRDAFALAYEAYRHFRPALEIIEAQMREHEVVVKAQKAKKDMEAVDKLVSRNRK